MLTHIKKFLVILVAVTALPVFADEKSPTSIVTEDLVANGYVIETISKTFWGRVKIVADKGDLEREVIINPYTGEVLRDLVRRRRIGQSSDGSGSGRSNASDDGLSDDDDDNSTGDSSDDEMDDPDEPDDERDEPDDHEESGDS